MVVLGTIVGKSHEGRRAQYSENAFTVIPIKSDDNYCSFVWEIVP